MAGFPFQIPVLFNAAVEGDLDEVVLRRLMAEAGLPVGSIYGKTGKDHLRKRIQDYNNAARFGPWIVLVDLDRDADCAVSLYRNWLLEPSPNLLFRVAVRAVEAWLLADRRMAEFVESHWRPEIAALNSDSLRRCRLRLRELARPG